MNKIVYSLKVMQMLVKRGHIPVATIPNPQFPQFNCWVFAATDQFLKDFKEIVGG